METKAIPPLTDSAYENGAEAFLEVMRRRHMDAAVVRADDVLPVGNTSELTISA